MYKYKQYYAKVMLYYTVHTYTYTCTLYTCTCVCDFALGGIERSACTCTHKAEYVHYTYISCTCIILQIYV